MAIVLKHRRKFVIDFLLYQLRLNDYNITSTWIICSSFVDASFVSVNFVVLLEPDILVEFGESRGKFEIIANAWNWLVRRVILSILTHNKVLFELINSQ